jgi:hypothetical protein
MATMLEEYITEEQLSVMLFFGGEKSSMGGIFIKKCFLFTVQNIRRVKAFTSWW